MGLRFEIGDWDWGLGLRLGIGLGIWIGNSNSEFGLGIGGPVQRAFEVGPAENSGVLKSGFFYFGLKFWPIDPILVL